MFFRESGTRAMLPIMSGGDGADVTQLLRRWSSGDESAMDELMPLVYDHLRRQAGKYLSAERPGHTLQATALVNEAFLKLVTGNFEPRDRGHFLALASRAMRQILVDHARARQRQKRGSGGQQVTLDDALAISAMPPEGLLDLDEALTSLAGRDSRKATIVEMLYFGGLTYEEASSALDIAPVTLHRELTLAKAWLARKLKGGQAS
jgi:RNA polymerase sigma-70 factor, ECF subfamily